nr:uncharacterized protein LOC127311933 [Lolium perenne]
MIWPALGRNVFNTMLQVLPQGWWTSMCQLLRELHPAPPYHAAEWVEMILRRYNYLYTDTQAEKRQWSDLDCICRLKESQSPRVVIVAATTHCFAGSVAWSGASREGLDAAWC